MFRHSSLHRAVAGRIVVVTGSSEGIGARLARRLAASGARVVLVARSMEKLEAVKERIEDAGGEAHAFPANLSSEGDCDRVLGAILERLGRVDIFVSNAGRSIRRSVKYQGSERFHDFQRLMALNYFGALRMILGVLPGMEEQGFGQVVHISSFGVPTRQPRFAGYCASKSALDAALQCAAGEVAAKGVAMSTVYMPLVQTKMVQSKGHSYDHVSMLSVDEACEYIEHAIITRKAEVIDAPSRFLSLMHTFNPSWVKGLNALVYKLESEKAPDDVNAKTLRRAKTQTPKMAVSKSNRILKLLGSFMWFFSRLELVLHVRCGVPWVLRDCLAFIVMALTLVATPVVVGLLSATRAARAWRRRLSGPAEAPQRPPVRAKSVRFAAPPLDADESPASATALAAAAQARAGVDVDFGAAAAGAVAAAGVAADKDQEEAEAEEEEAEAQETVPASRRARRARTQRACRDFGWHAPQPALLPKARSMLLRASHRRRTGRAA